MSNDSTFAPATAAERHLRAARILGITATVSPILMWVMAGMAVVSVAFFCVHVAARIGADDLSFGWVYSHINNELRNVAYWLYSSVWFGIAGYLSAYFAEVMKQQVATPRHEGNTGAGGEDAPQR